MPTNPVHQAVSHVPGSFFGDFPVLEYGPIAEETGDIMLRALKLFGWEVSEDKLKPFAAKFEALELSSTLLPSTGSQRMPVLLSKIRIRGSRPLKQT